MTKSTSLIIMSESANVRVLCRFRPINGRERREFIEAGKDPEQMICKFLDEFNLEVLLEAGLGSKKYGFDRVYPPGVPQRDVYNLAANDTVVQILNGYNGTILSYGQTGAGKSFSMFGADIHNEEMKGIIPRAGDHIFKHISCCDNPDIEFNIRCAFLEIYNESVNDLLARGPEHENLKIRENPDRGIFVENATETQVCSVEDMITIITIGDANRAVSSTNMNAVSSRSHTVIIIFVGQSNKADQSKQDGKMCLVDLAGSEKTSKTAAEGQRLVEANNINASLTTLGQCIKMLADGDGKAHIPYRQSKLTRLLQESLGGNAKTTLLIACSPHPFNREETISTCEFGKRAKSIKNKVKVNATKSVKELMAIIDKLQIQIAGMQRYIDMQAELIKWYTENGGATPTVYVPTPADLQLLMAGKKLAIDGGEAEGAGENGTPTGNSANVDLNGDASLRIAHLQSQVEKEQEKNHLMKENLEADIKDLERKLAEAQHNQKDVSDDEGGTGGRKVDESVLFELKKVKAERDAYKKQLFIAMGEELEESDDYDEDEDEDEDDDDESESDDEDDKAEGGKTTPTQEQVIQKEAKKEKAKKEKEKKERVKFEVAPLQFGGKKIGELQKKVEELESQNDTVQNELDSEKARSAEEMNQLNYQINSLKHECNRLRGVSSNDAEQPQEAGDEQLDEKDKIIRILEKELKQMREAILIQKSENQKVKLLQQRLDAANDRYIKSQASVVELEDKLKEQQDIENLKQTNVKLERTLQMKAQDIQTYQQRIDISDQRIAHLTKQMADINTTINKLKKEKHEVQKQKEEDVQRLINDFEMQKAKLQENMLSREKIYKPVVGTNIATNLAQNNPEILDKLKSIKQRWVVDDDQ